MYGKMLLTNIQREKDGTDYIYGPEDRHVLQQMLKEINENQGTNLHYLAEIDAFNLKGAGEIMRKYIACFQSESVRAYCIPQMVEDRIPDCDAVLLSLYRHFQKSSEFLPVNRVLPAHIYVRYDNAFKRRKSKRCQNELLKVVLDPISTFYLPLTVKMLSSWKVSALYEYLLRCAHHQVTFPSEFQEALSKEQLAFANRQIMFTVIAGFRYFATEEAAEILRDLSHSDDHDIRRAANTSLKLLQAMFQ